jgi:hypothetical protein
MDLTLDYFEEKAMPLTVYDEKTTFQIKFNDR